MRICLLAVLGLLTATAHGQSVFKCKQPDGVTAYQDHPCPGAPDAHPAMTITPADEARAHPSQWQQLTPQQQAQLAQARVRLAQSLQRLESDLRRMQAKQAQAARSAPQGDTPNIH